MKWFFGHKKKAARDSIREELIQESQRILIEAATSTANAAKDVTARLKECLDDSLRLFEGTARVLNDALLVCDSNGIIRTANVAASRMFGLPELVGLPITELFVQNDSTFSRSVGELWTIIEQNPTWSPTQTCVLKGITSAGVVFDIDPSITRLDWSNKTSSMLVLVRNMSPWLELSGISESSKTHLDAIVDMSFDGIIVEQNGKIVAANPAIARIFSYTVDELLNRPVNVLFNSNDHTKIEKDDSRIHTQVQGVKTDGRHIDILFTATRIVLDGVSTRLITLKDITPQKIVRELTSRDNGIDMICCFDTNFIITFVNQSFANFHNIQKAEILGKDIRNFVHNTKIFETGISGLSSTNPTCRSQHMDGVRIYDWIDHAILNMDSIVEYQRVGRDITEAVQTLG